MFNKLNIKIKLERKPADWRINGKIQEIKLLVIGSFLEK